MKKSEALRILGLSAGATDDDIKAAHRRKVMENHPDKFALDSTEHARAEEKTKLINEARDVLISRKWEPEYVRRGPYANPHSNPYASPYSNPHSNPHNPYRGETSRSSGAGHGTQGWPGGASSGNNGNPFDGWPFGQGQGSWVWTSWDGVSGQGGRPFNPFYDATEPQKTPEERKAEAKKDLTAETAVIAAKIVCLAAFSIAGSFPVGLFLYVVISVVYGLWKRFRGCLLPFLIPISLLLVPFLFIIAPRAGMMTFGLVAACFLAFIFDINAMRHRVAKYRSIKV